VAYIKFLILIGRLSTAAETVMGVKKLQLFLILMRQNSVSVQVNGRVVDVF